MSEQKQWHTRRVLTRCHCYYTLSKIIRIYPKDAFENLSERSVLGSRFFLGGLGIESEVKVVSNPANVTCHCTLCFHFRASPIKLSANVSLLGMRMIRDTAIRLPHPVVSSLRCDDCFAMIARYVRYVCFRTVHVQGKSKACGRHVQSL